MKKFPRLYAISTVGLIHHNNSDFLFHPLRTDFTGESGSGKSMISDLLQLILVARKGKEYYKPGTETSDKKDKREVEDLPLSDFGYAFLTIEKEEKKFIIIGTYIQKGAKTITPFIIQKGINWKENTSFEYLDKMLLAKDFLLDKHQIPPIEKLKKEILKPKGFILESFRQTSLFHNLLDYNKILPLDLSNDENKLKSFAQVLQSFARAKSLTFDGDGIKNFLFSDEDSIYKAYEAQKQALEGFQRSYVENEKTIDRVTKRFQELHKLKNAKTERDSNHKAYLTADVGLAHQEYMNAKNLHEESNKQYAVSRLKEIEIGRQISQIKKSEAETNVKHITKELKKQQGELLLVPSKREILQKNSVTYNTDKTAAETAYTTAKREWEDVQILRMLLLKYKTLNRLTEAAEHQIKLNKQKEQLSSFRDLLKKEQIESLFKNSLWSKSFTEALEDSGKSMEALDRDIEKLENLAVVYDANNKGSLINWVIENNKGLDIDQESVIKSFIALSTIKPTADALEYIPNPLELLNKLAKREETIDGFWIDLGGLYRQITRVKKEDASFNNITELKQALERQKDSIETDLEKKKEEKKQKVRMQTLLSNHGFNEDLLAIYLKEKELLGFQADSNIPSIDWIESVKGIRPESDHYEHLYSLKEKAFAALVNQENETTPLLAKLDQEEKKLKESIEKFESESLPNAESYLDALNKEEFTLDTDKDNHLVNYSKYLPSEKQTEIAQDIAKLIVRQKGNPDEKKHQLTKELLIDQGKYIKTIEDLDKRDNSKGLFMLGKAFEESKSRFEKELTASFEIISRVYLEPEVNDLQSNYIASKNEYEHLYNSIVDEFAKDNIQLKENKDYELLVRNLLPQLFEGKRLFDIEANLEEEVSRYLKSINDKLKDINDHKLQLIQTVFSNVSKFYEVYQSKVKEIDRFFKHKQITGGHTVEIKFTPSKAYPINWISSLTRRINNRANEIGLFKRKDNEEQGGEEIIKNTFLEFSESNIKDPDIRRLTNPKAYFDLEVYLIKPNGKRSGGSTGQDYTKIALLCIARLSMIENASKKGDIIPGIRFMPIDEVAGLGGNFDLLYDIAMEYDYQILTMTVTPDLKYEQGKQYVYMLNLNNNPDQRDINMPAFGRFSKKELKKDLQAYITALDNEERPDLADH